MSKHNSLHTLPIVLLVLLGLGLTQVGCSQDHTSSKTMLGRIYAAGPFQIQVAVDPDPPKAGKNRLTLIVQDKDGKPVNDAQFEAAAVMPAMHAGMELKLAEAGRYTSDLDIPMDGAWPLSLSITSPTRGRAELSFDMGTNQTGLRLASATPSDIKVPGAPAHADSASSSPASGAGTIVVDARRRQLIGLTTGKVVRRPLVLSINAAGQVNYDETTLTDISLKFNGWIGKLYANYVGARIVRGQPLFTVYSPALVSAQEEYLETFRHGRNQSLLAAGAQRLGLWDITPAQIRKLEQRDKPWEQLPILAPFSGTVIEKNIVDGTSVTAGKTLLRIADLSRVWIDGQVYEYELPHVHVGMPVEVIIRDVPGKTFKGRISYVDPFLQDKTRTARVRVELPNPEGTLRPEMYAEIHLQADLGERLVVPEPAVLFSGEKRVVFVDLGDGRLQPRLIKTGAHTPDWIEVLDGLAAGDTVVTSANFLISSETKLKSGIEQW